MIKKSILYPSALALVFSASISAEEVLVQLKFEPGKVYITETEVKQSAVIAMAGQEMKTAMTMKATTSQTVTKAETGVTIVQKMDSMFMDMDAAGMKMTFDSENPEGPLAMMFGPLMEAETTMNLGPDGKVISIKAQAVPGMEAMGMGKEEMTQAAREMTDMMANKTVAEGASWTTTSKLPTGGMTEKPVTINYTMTFDSMVEKEEHRLAKILIVGKVDEGDGNLQVTSKELTGEMLFDPKIGQPREMTMIVDLEIGLPEGAEVAEGAPGKMPMRTETVSKLKGVK
ncbi:MAG: DUF6263 family protein [Roseibacillus sp.]